MTFPNPIFMIQKCCWGQGCSKATSSVCSLLWLPQRSRSLLLPPIPTAHIPFILTLPGSSVCVCVCVLNIYSKDWINDWINLETKYGVLYKICAYLWNANNFPKFLSFFHISEDLGHNCIISVWLCKPLYFHCFDPTCVWALKLLFASLYNLYLEEVRW